MSRIAFLMDPLASLALKKDSTLAMIKAAQQRELEVFYFEQKDLMLSEGKILARLQRIRLTDQFLATMLSPKPDTAWCDLDDPIVCPLSDMDIVMMRKDPPFDMQYIYTTYLLEQAEREGTQVINRPRSLRDCNEKLFATQFPQCCPPLVVSQSKEVLKAFYDKHENVVLKKLDGMGGASIFRVMAGDPNLTVIIETLTDGERVPIMAQTYLPEIVDGDKRILLIDGEPIPYALARIPSAGETRGNLAAGGRGEGRPLTDRDRWIAEQIGPELRQRGLAFVGIDVIGDYLTEINVTCPTCVRELDHQFELDIAGDLIEYALTIAAAK